MTDPIVSNVVSNILECVICLDPCASPIFNCTNGHLTCGFCYDKLVAQKKLQCAICKDPLCQSYHAERLSRQWEVKIKCSSGCSAEILASNIKDHIPVCEYRDVICNELTDKPGGKTVSCNKKVPLKQYFHHLTDIHNYAINNWQKVIVDYGINKIFALDDPSAVSEWTRKCLYEFTLLRFDNHEFLIHAAVWNYSFHWWMTLLGGTEEADKYSYITELKEETNYVDRIKCAVSFTLPVLSFHSHRNFIPTCGKYASASAAAVSNSYAKRNELNDKFEFKIRLRLIKNSAEMDLDRLSLGDFSRIE